MIKMKGIQEISKALEINKTLNQLYLGNLFVIIENNKLGDKGIMSLSKSLYKTSTLTQLNLRIITIPYKTMI